MTPSRTRVLVETQNSQPPETGDALGDTVYAASLRTAGFPIRCGAKSRIGSTEGSTPSSSRTARAGAVRPGHFSATAEESTNPTDPVYSVKCCERCFRERKRTPGMTTSLDRTRAARLVMRMSRCVKRSMSTSPVRIANRTPNLSLRATLFPAPPKPEPRSSSRRGRFPLAATSWICSIRLAMGKGTPPLGTRISEVTVFGSRPIEKPSAETFARWKSETDAKPKPLWVSLGAPLRIGTYRCAKHSPRLWRDSQAPRLCPSPDARTLFSACRSVAPRTPRSRSSTRWI